MLAVIFVLAATLTLLPAVLAKLGPRVDRLALPWAHSGEHRSAGSRRWGERLWRHPLRYGAIALAILLGLAIPGHPAEDLDAVDQGRPAATPRGSATTQVRPHSDPARPAHCRSSHQPATRQRSRRSRDETPESRS